jgi:hypothetical protein
MARSEAAAPSKPEVSPAAVGRHPVPLWRTWAAMEPMNHEMRAAVDITVAMIGAWVSPEDDFSGTDGDKQTAAAELAANMYETVYRRIRKLEKQLT